MTPRAAGKTRAEARAKAGTFWQKALRFAHAAMRNATEGDWDPAVANAVNAAINATDAVLVHTIGVRSASESHFDVLNLLPTSNLPDATRAAMARHLESLLNVKTIAQCEGRLLARHDAEAALKHLDRFFDALRTVAKSNDWPMPQ